jgi:UDP-N-acetylmuramate dehydrogenase
VIKLEFNDFYQLDYPGSFYVGGGVFLPRLLGLCLEQSLGGLEFLAGVPASLGGILANNTSFKGKDALSLVQKIRILDTESLSISFIDKILIEEGYHASLEKSLILGASIFLEPKDKTAIKKEIKDNIAYRLKAQEAGVFCAGCIFKNPEGDVSAGRLIEEAGLKGLKKGQARISDKHANFIINEKEARSCDVVFLIEETKERVYNKSGVRLEEEIIRWGC